MATYYHGNSEIQSPDGGLQTLVLMNHGGYVPYSDATQQQHSPSAAATNQQLVFLNSAGANNQLAQASTLPHAPPSHTQQFVGIPLPTVSTQDPSNSQGMHPHHDMAALHAFMPRIQTQYALWNSIDPSTRDTPRAQQGLSLSLSSQQPGFGSFRGADREVPTGEDIRVSSGSTSSASGVTNGISGMQSVLLSSKYLKAAQELLDEVVNVGNGMRTELPKKGNGNQSKAMAESSMAAAGDGSVGGDQDSGKRAVELSTAERQEIQMKKGKLITMLDEVDQRYRQYHRQMQMVIASFEQAIQFPDCIHLILNLLRSESSSTCEAAAGLLRSIALVNSYRDLVANSGAIEEITGLLTRASTTSEVKEQAICTLWNLSVDEKFRMKIANSDILPLLVKSLDDEDIKVKEAAGGVLANLALSEFNHGIMVEAGVIPKLAKLFRTDIEGSKVIKKEAKNALLELCKDRYHRITIIEEGLVPVPMIGAAAYKAFRPGLYSWPSLPDGTQIEQTSNTPSRFGASELLIGLHVDDKNANIEEAKMNAIVGRTQQQFLARIGAIEMDDEKKQSEIVTGQQLTLLPWVDGVARLVLILGLEDESAIVRAAESVADASINEHMRISFKEAGAVKLLVQLLDSKNDAIRLAAIQALERLSVSHVVCQIIEAEGALDPLVNILKNPEIPEILMEKALDILGRILDPSKEMKSKFYDGPVNGSRGSDAARGSHGSKGVTGDVTHTPISKTNPRENVLDSVVITRLLEILKTPTPRLQRKAASILEFCTVIDPSMETITSVDIESGLDVVLQQKVLEDMESEVDYQQPGKHVLEVEEAGLVISAASRLLTKLLDSDRFCQKIDTAHFTKLLCNILKSDIPVRNKDWAAGCLVKLGSLSGPRLNVDDPINMEVTLHETIPRLMEQLKTSFSLQSKEAAVIELNRIISEGVVDSTRAVAAQGGIFPLVELIEEGSDRAVEACLAILYNLSMDSENHSAILSAGAVPVLRRIVLSERPQWRRALHLLRTLPTLESSA